MMPVDNAQREKGGQRYRLHTWDGSHAVDQLLEKEATFVLIVLSEAKVDREHQTAAKVKARIYRQDVAEASNKQTRADKQNQGECNLESYE
jgi:hypothetical protein